MPAPTPPAEARGASLRRPVGALSFVLATGLAASAVGAPPVDFGRDVRPILSDHCFACHGPDPATRKADLRLDRKDDALRDRGGYAAIVPGDVEASELVFRIRSDDDPLVIMPPPKAHKPLSEAQKATLERWIAAGAPWPEHWAFVAPGAVEPPAVADAAWPRNPIDRFILSRLEEEGLAPETEADRTTLLRRVTLDLTGLPPTPAEIDAFLADKAPGAYERAVDRLLDSPRFGEHRARYWLDAARYGDTHGLHLDNYREIWPYRDWVIRAFNANKPYDTFVIEQLAGDLLPDASLDQVIATGFNRCHVTTSEGGSIEEEVYVRNNVERVDATGTVFLGLTVGCARCHDHKFDPITQKDYYALFAFFNNIDGRPLDGNSARHAPVVRVPTEAQEAALEAAEARVADARRVIAEAVASAEYDDAQDAALGEYVERADFDWIDDALPAGARPSAQGGSSKSADGAWSFVGRPDHPVLSGEHSVRQQAGEGPAQQDFTGAQPALKVGPGDTLFAHVFLDPTDPPEEIMLQWHSDGWKHRAYWGANRIDLGQDGTPERRHVGPLPISGKWVRLEVPASEVGLSPGSTVTGWALTQHGGTVYWDRAGLETWTPQDGQESYDTLTAWVRSRRALKGAGLPKDIQQIVALERAKRTDDQKARLRAYFLEHAYRGTREIIAPLKEALAKAEKERDAQAEAIPTTMVFKERAGEPRTAYILDRGEYDRRKDPVGRAVPGFLPSLPDDAPRDRLALARWLVSAEHPLTARVAVNRFWSQCFGAGLVRTVEDFGAQGEPPSHPELLDWLAVEFRRSGWDVKGLFRLMVTSAAYRQSSRVAPEKLAKDPANRLLARGPRFRLDAEVIRDQALAAGGLLVGPIGGPSVKPPQPPGLWEAVAYTGSNTARFKADTEYEKIHRRSLYTFWKRTAPPPQMAILDAPSRESCTVRRERTDTPLQALLLMNEAQFVEAARGLAARALREGGPDPAAQLSHLFRLATARRPDAEELAELATAYRDHLAAFRGDAEAARALLDAGGESPEPSDAPALDPAELAAATMVANLVLNLDEVVTKE